MKSAGILIVFAMACQVTKAQLPAIPGTGINAYSNKPDLFSSFSNVASLAALTRLSAALYMEQKFLLKELGHYRSIMGWVTNAGNFAVHTIYSGFSGFNELQVGIAYARKLGNEIDIGVRFNYHTISITGYGKAATMGVEAGTLFHLSEKLHTGIHVINPVGGKFGSDKAEKLPSVYIMGMSYDVSDKFFVSTVITKEENQPVDISPGFQYSFTEAFLIKAGISSVNTAGWMGVVLAWKKMTLDITTTYHFQLGFTPALTFHFRFNAKSGKEEKAVAE